MEAEVTRWQGSEPPDADTLREELAREPHTFATWSNGPADSYAPHSHSYDKLLVCLRGSITFTLPATGQRLALAAGDRLGSRRRRRTAQSSARLASSAPRRSPPRR